MKKVLVVGSAIIDILVKSNDFRVLKSHQVKGGVALCEVYGGKTEAGEIVLETGGAGTNVAVGLSRLGHLAAVISRTGNDWMRERITSSLNLEGVDFSMIQEEKGGSTGLSVVLIAPDGGRSIITYRGSSKEINAREIDWKRVASADWIQISSLGGNMELLEDLTAFASEKKIRVGLNPGKLELEQHERLLKLLPKLDLLIVNRMEAATLLRTEYVELIKLAEKILALGARMVAITDGKKGAAAAADGRFVSAPTFGNKSTDDTGAGDAFSSGFLAGVLLEMKLADCLKMGNANGSSKVMELGAKRGLLHRSGMEKWMKKKLKTVEERL